MQDNIVEAQKEEIKILRDKIEAQRGEIDRLREELVSSNEISESQKRELEFTVENLKLAQSQLVQSEKMASVGVLTAGIAHELNNPINFVSGNVYPLQQDLDEIFSIIKKYDEAISANKLSEFFIEIEALKEEMEFSFLIQEIHSLLKGIEEGANRSTEIIKGLRSFSRIDDEQCQFYNIHEGIDSSLVLLNNKIKDKIIVRKDYGDFEGLECFPSKLNQVIMNILTNSIQAMEGKGDPTRGKDLFTRQGCIACHTVSEDQPPKGPYLGNGGKFPREYLIEAILDPSRVVAQASA